jgi:hypothetical protein
MQMDKDFDEAQFWFKRKDGKRYYAKQEGDRIVLLNSHDKDEKIRFSKDKLQQDIKDNEIIDYGIE